MYKNTPCFVTQDNLVLDKPDSQSGWELKIIMIKTISVALLLFALVINGTAATLAGPTPATPDGDTGTLEKMIIASGNVAMDLDLSRLNGTAPSPKAPKTGQLNFDVEANSFFPVLVLNNELRGTLPGSMALIPQNTLNLPDRLSAAANHLTLESLDWGGQYELVVRDAKTGFVFFAVEGHEFKYSEHALSFGDARLLISKDFAEALGRPADAGKIVGSIRLTANMTPTEVSQIVNGEVRSEGMPSVRNPEAGSVPGPDVIVGDLSGLAQFGSSSGTQVGLAVGTDSCNFGVENLHWFQNPENDHPVIPQNLYRMSGGTNNDERFEQIGQSNVKHAFTALTNNICGLGCNGVGGANLGSGCSDPYSASLNSGPNLGSRAWINPYTGFYPRNDGGTTNNSHTGHTHLGPSHRVLVEMADLIPAQNPGATYYAESQYVTPHEYAWCSTHPGQCNMNNNVSYRRYSVTNSASPFTFSPVGTTVRQKSALAAWTGATIVDIQPDPGNDGIGAVAYKVTNPSAGVWHYEYAIYNQNMDRAISSFTVPTGNGVTISNVGFHAPPQQPGWTNDGTLNNAGFSSAPWTQVTDSGATTWRSQSMTENANANAVRWGTLYNIRFDSNRPPQAMNATLGFLKTGAPISVQVQGPAPVVVTNATVTGRVLNTAGNPLRGAIVIMTDSQNVSRFAVTSTFGYFSFDNVTGGQSYTFSVSNKRFNFNSQNVVVNGDIANLDFTAVSANRIK